jgi:hypothetical protein
MRACAPARRVDDWLPLAARAASRCGTCRAARSRTPPREGEAGRRVRLLSRWPEACLRRLRPHDPALGSRLRRVAASQPRAGAVRELAFSPDGAKLASCSLSDDGRLWDAATRTALSGYDGRRAHLSVAFAPSGDVAYSLDGRLLAAGADDWAAYVSDAPSRELASLFRAHAGYVNGGEFSPDGMARSGCGACRPPEGRETTGMRRRQRIVALWPG